MIFLFITNYSTLFYINPSFLYLKYLNSLLLSNQLDAEHVSYQNILLRKIILKTSQSQT